MMKKKPSTADVGIGSSDELPSAKERTSKPSTLSAAYGDAFREFEWSYAVDALPRPTGSKRRSTHNQFGRSSGYMNDEWLDHLIQGVVRDLEARQGNEVMYAYIFESGLTGFRHLHAYIGNLSRLTKKDVAEAFRANGFGDTLVKQWDSALDSGYYFKSLDQCRDIHGYDKRNWNTNVKWNRNCKQRMKLMRRHLDDLLASRKG